MLFRSHLTMVFPDVRLKKFIEIRMPDALPYPFNLAVTALVKGIFYDTQMLEKYYQKSLEVNDDWVIHQNACLIQGVQSLELEAMKEELLCDAMASLNTDEASVIGAFKAFLAQWGSMTAYLQHLYQTDRQAFAQAIIVNPIRVKNQNTKEGL